MPAAHDRRAHLLDTALRLLQTQGFGALTQTALAAAAGIRQGLLTYYFPRRSDLLRAIAEHAAARALPPLPASHESREPHRIDVSLIRQRLVEESTDDGMPRLMLSLILMAEEDPELARWVASFQLGLFAQLDRLLRSAGRPVPRERLERLHATLIGLRIRRLMRLPGDDDQALRAMVDRAFRDAVEGPDRPPSPPRRHRTQR